MVAAVTLPGEKVRLREFRVSDGDAIMRLVGDARITRYLSFESLSRAQAEAMIAGTIERAALDPRTEYYLAITPKDADEFVGFVRIGLTGIQAAKLGYAIAVDQQGRGYATDAARTMLDFAFDSLGLHRVTAAIGPDNAASIAVVDKLGFTFEGTLRDHVFTNGVWRHSQLYSVLAHEWAATDS